MQINWKLLGGLIAFLLIASGALAQTVGPTALEFKGPKAHGTIFVKNNSAGVLAVQVGPQGFDFTGGVHIIPLPGDIEFHTKQILLTLGPGQTKYVDFDVRCAALPCHFYVTPVFTTPKVENGLNMAMHIPCAIYLCSDKAKGCRQRTLIEAGISPAK